MDCHNEAAFLRIISELDRDDRLFDDYPVWDDAEDPETRELRDLPPEVLALLPY